MELREHPRAASDSDACRGAPIPWWPLGLAFFAYTAMVAVLVQVVLLPHVFPAYHAGHGLLIGGDWLEFHRIASRLADQIRAEGWGLWTLRPEGQAPVGITALIYALTVSEPWTVIPLNAALHATAALMLLRILLCFVAEWRLAIWGVFPFLLYPSAMTWYTQIHKDGFFILGAYCFVYGWILLARVETWQRRWWPPARASLWILTGAALVWVVRPYGVQMLQAIASLVAAIVTVVFLIRSVRCTWTWRHAFRASLVCWTIILLLTPFTQGGLSDITPTVRAEQLTPSDVGALEPGPRFRLDQEFAGWMLVGYDVDEAALVRDEAVDVKLYWLPPQGREPATSEDMYQQADGRWVQWVRGVTNRVPDGAFEKGSLSNFPDDLYQAGPEPRQLFTDTRNGRPSTVAMLRNNPSIQHSSLVSDPVRAEPGRLYLQSGWLRGEASYAFLGREWLPSTEYGYVAVAVSPQDWAHYARALVAPETVKAARVWLLNYESSGTAYFDDVAFVELGALGVSPCQGAESGDVVVCTSPLVSAHRMAPDGSWVASNWLPARAGSWRYSGWLPDFVERRIYTLATIRDGSRTYHRAATNIDMHVVIRSASDLFSYVPRAAQIGLLAPFPSQWFERGSLEVSALQRRITGLEMAVVYMSLLALLWGAWYWRRRVELWIVLCLCIGMILTYSIGTVNVGTLYRARYGFLMLLVALGVAAGILAWRTFGVARRRRKRLASVAS
jgi:hypothetical protein